MPETRTQTLPEFLMARIADDEDVIRSTGAPLYRTEARGVVTMRVPAGYSLEPAAQRAVAECAAKRQIVEESQALNSHPVYRTGYDHAFEIVLLALAQPYADHPDFREEWRADA